MIPLTEIQAIVEATNFEVACLWGKYHDELRLPWEEHNDGFGPIVGKVYDMPVCISIFTAIVDGVKILFWHPTSMVVDHRMIDEWLKLNCPQVAPTSFVNAQNFHNAVRHQV